MWIPTTWPYRRERRPRKPSRVLAGAGRLGIPRDTTAAPTTPTGDRPSLQDYAGLPAEGQLGFEQSSYTFFVEVGETEQPTPEGRVLLGKVTARTAGYESPSAYYLEDVPIALNLEITPDGSLWWITDHYPTYAQRLFPGTQTSGLRDRYLLAGARLRDQRVRTNIIITPVPLERRRLRDTLVLDANGTPITNSQQAGWRYAQPTGVPLPTVNFSAVLTGIRAAWDTAFAVFRLTNPFARNPNPFRTDDLAAIAIGGVQMRMGYISLKDAFINRVADEFIVEYSARIDHVAMKATTKPYCPRISDFGNDDARLADIRDNYGHYVVWWPITAHNGDLTADLTVTATSIYGDKYETTWSVSSINLRDPVLTTREDVNIPTSNTLETGDLRLPLALGIDQSEHWLDMDVEGLDKLEFNLALLPSSVSQRFIDLVETELEVFAAAKGRALDLVVRGKLVAWQIAWATDSDSGSYYLWPASSNLYQYAPGASFELVTSSLGGARPPGSEKRGTMGTQTLSGVFQPDSEGNVAESLGPHLTIKAHSTGIFSIRGTASPGATIVQIVPFVHEWYAWSIPIPGLGRVLSGILTRVLRLWGSSVHRQTQRALRQFANPRQLDAGFVLANSLAYRRAQAFVGQQILDKIGPRLLFKSVKAIYPLANQAQSTAISSALSISSSKSLQQFENSVRLARSNDVTVVAGGFANLGFDGLFGPPVVGPILWQGDYVCGKFVTFPAGTFRDEDE